MDREFRVIRRTLPSGRAAYVIYQVCYDGQGAVEQVSADPVSPYRETVEELRADLERMRHALELPILMEEEVLDSLEISGATAYGRWFRAQIGQKSLDDEPVVSTSVSPDEQLREERRRMEEVAEVFAEKRRKEPSFGVTAEVDDT